MGGDEHAPIVDGQQDFEKVSGRYVQGRASVAGQVSPARERGVDALHRPEAGGEEQHVDTAAPATLLRDTAHLGAQDEPDPAVLEQPVAGVTELAATLPRPDWMREVATG